MGPWRTNQPQLDGTSLYTRFICPTRSCSQQGAHFTQPGGSAQEKPITHGVDVDSSCRWMWTVHEGLSPQQLVSVLRVHGGAGHACGGADGAGALGGPCRAEAPLHRHRRRGLLEVDRLHGWVVGGPGAGTGVALGAPQPLRGRG